jgi:hypothetical protein
MAKYRTGFVSNSSSSSFIIKVGEPFDTALEVAKHMIPKRERDDDAELVAKVEDLERRCYCPSAVTFHTCNYDTFIAKVKDHFLIETSHHGDWDLSSFTVPCPSEYAETYGDDTFYRLPHSMDFYSLEYGVTGRPLDYEDSSKFEDSRCNKCYTEFWWIDGLVQCPKCNTEAKRKTK